jgi:hypothetical protein
MFGVQHRLIFYMPNLDPRHNAFALGFRLAGPENFLQKFLGTLAQDDT